MPPPDLPVLVNKAARQFINGHTPQAVRPTFQTGDADYLAFWRNVEDEIKRISGKTAVIPEWYKLGWA